MGSLSFCLIFIVLSPTDGAVPGTFFWKPRLGLDLAIPTTELNMEVQMPSKESIGKGLVVLIDGYSAGMTIVAIAAGIADANPYPHLDPTRSFFYTNAYRWALRHISLLPFWLGGNGGSYCATHKIWKRRFFYMDEIIPKWMRSTLFFVGEKDWNKEIKDLRRYKKFSEYTFAKHYKVPSKKFNNFKSYETKESIEISESQSSSFLSSQSLP